MSLSNAFNDDTYGYNFSKSSDFVLSIRVDSSASGYLYQAYDFAARLLMVRSGGSDGGLSVTPFSQLDREVLEAYRDKLIALHGKPPALPVVEDQPQIFSKLKPARGA